jgi:hypothetical protein
MLTFALRSLLARRRCALLSVLAVMLGVAMVSGTFVFHRHHQRSLPTTIRGDRQRGGRHRRKPPGPVLT